MSINKNSYKLWIKGLYIGDKTRQATKKEVIEMLNKATINVNLYEKLEKSEEKALG